LDDAKPPDGGIKSIPIDKRPEGTYNNLREKIEHEISRIEKLLNDAQPLLD
jgi:hypothetical protein